MVSLEDICSLYEFSFVFNIKKTKIEKKSPSSFVNVINLGGFKVIKSLTQNTLNDLLDSSVGKMMAIFDFKVKYR